MKYSNSIFLFLITVGFCLSAVGSLWAIDEESLLMSDEVVPWQELGKDFVERPRPVTEVLEDKLFPENQERIEIIERAHETGDASLLDEAPDRRNLFGGNPFLATGPLAEGFEIGTGAVWQPVFLLYGEGRTALQTFDNGFGNTTEWANRLDIFGNLYLTPTERILIGLRPLDRNGGFTGYQFEGDDEGFFENFDSAIQTLFFEGDFGELFPRLDSNDSRNFDYGFAFGRQPLNFQDGILINDTIDSIGVSRASLFTMGANAARITGIAGFNQVHRGDNVRDRDAFIYGLLSSFDYDRTTIEVDFVYVDGDEVTGGDGIYGGIGDTRRIGEWNSTTRLNGSHAFDDGSDAVNSGAVLTSQLSRTMTYNDDIFYFDSFYGVDDFTSAARDPSVGGPLGPIGILFASPMLGEFGAPLGNQVGESVGFAAGYQHFLGGRRGSLIAELGGRLGTDAVGENSLGAALRYQKAFGQHSILQLDSFVTGYDDEDNLSRDDLGAGLRAEWRVKF